MRQKNILLTAYKNKCLDKKIDSLELDNSIIIKLKENNIHHVEDLWKKNKKYLKEIGLNDHDIYQITVKLQLLSLDLNKKIYEK